MKKVNKIKSSWKYFHSRHIFISVHSLLLAFVNFEVYWEIFRQW